MNFDTSTLRMAANSPEVHAAALSIAAKECVKAVQLWEDPGIPSDKTIEMIAEIAAKLVKFYLVRLGNE